MTFAGPDTTQFDVAIVGGGMVGGVLACSLAESGLRVALIERGSLADAATSAGERSVALSWGSKVLLEAIGLWQDLEEKAEPIRRIHVSQQGHLGAVRMRAEEHKIDALGYVVRNAKVSECLADRLPQISNLKVFAPVEVQSLSQRDTDAELRLSDGLTLNAELIVVADGGDSPIRESLGLDADVEDYEQHAVVATLTSQGSPQGMAWERFTANGPMALLPLGQDRLSLVYTLPSEDRDALLDLNDEAFLAQVQSSIGRRAGRFVSTSSRQCFPLRRVSVDPSWQGRALLLGNAARTLHPVAGQGFNLALRDAMTLAELLHNLAVGEDAGASFVREQYLQRRQADQRETIGLTDALARMFRGDSSLLGHLRGAGLIATDRLPLLKRGFARRSMGLAHRTPKVVAPT